MADILWWAGSTLVLLGALTSVIGSVGVLRFPDFYTRTHAVSITDTLASTLVLLGLGLIGGASMLGFKVFIAWAFIMLSTPTAAHALANAAWSQGLKPFEGRGDIDAGADAGGPTP